MRKLDPSRLSRAQKARLWRWAMLGAAIFGVIGFFGGVAICLVGKLPIPPLFTTELGILLGGCLGASLGCLTTLSPPAAPQGSDLY